MPLDQPKIIRAWTFYDWANSAYSLIITSAIFPMYYSAIAPEQLQLFGFNLSRASVASYAIALSFLIISILSPFLSSMADQRRNKKAFMKFFCYLGALACMGMFFFQKNPDTGTANIFFGLACSILASIGYCGSIVFYNAFLPEISSKEKQDKVSARGFAMGYIGSVILMVVCFIFILWNDSHAMLSADLPARISFVLVALWWIGFAQITFAQVPEDGRTNSPEKESILQSGFKNLKEVWKSLQHQPALQLFLVSFFFYNMGVQTVMYMATYFASDELHMKTTELLATVLIIQLVAIGGATLFSYLSFRQGNKFALMILLIIWIGICGAAYLVQTVNEFYLLAFSVGMVMGGIQSLSRSTYSKLLPATSNTAAYFSFYDVCEKIGIVIGTLSFGLVADLLGGMRYSVIAIGIYFLIGLLILTQLKNSNFKTR